MATLRDLVNELGPVVLDPDPIGHGVQVDDLCLHAPATPIAAGDLVLAVAVTTTAELRQLVSEAITIGAAGVVTAVAADPSVVDLIRRGHLTVATKAVSTSWADLFRSMQSALSVTHPDDSDVLQQLADRLATSWQAPITIEDLDGQLITHSGDQVGADEARRTTIVERGTGTESMLRHRALGLYDALRTVDQVWIAPTTTHRGRTVIALRWDGDLVGTVWVLGEHPLAAEQIPTVAPVLSSIARHLADPRPLRGGATATARALRAILHQAPTSAQLGLGTPPWVVTVISCPTRRQEVHLTIWYERFRRRGWQDPLITAVDDAVVCVLAEEGTAPGSLAWWRNQVKVLDDDPQVQVAVGPRAMNTAELQHSHREAVEITRICQLWPELSGDILDPDTHWASLAILRLLDQRPAAERWQIGPMPHLLALPQILRRTLVCHLEHGSNIPRTAAALSIHPNTLRYRLGKITAAGVDLEDPLALTALHLLVLAHRADRQPIES